MHRLLTFLLLSSSFALAQGPLREVEITITNPSEHSKPAEGVVIPFAQLRQAAPQINAGSVIVSVDKTELPSQVDDLDGDGKADELAFQIDLQPRQTRTVKITYGDPDPIYRKRSEYPRRTYALFANKIEGIGWESEENAWRLYFDPRNAIDLYGKRRAAMFLDILVTPEYIYHLESPNGRDIYKVGNAIGIGAVGGWVDGKIIKVSDVASRKWRIISSGPVRSIIELTYEGWKVGGGKTITLRSRIEQWAGDRGFFHTVFADNAEALTFATGLPIKPNVPVFRSEGGASPAWLASYGEQVVQPGETATEEQKGTNLGLAIIALNGTPSEQKKDDLNYLLTFPLTNGSARWYVAAAWDQEGINNKPATSGIKTEAEFLQWLAERRAELASSVRIKFIP